MTDSIETTQESLDSTQYQTASILQYESIYGEDFVSPGGKDVAREMISLLEVSPGSRVLDVGCGLGGSAFLMAREFDLSVEGIDLSRNMLEIAKSKLQAYGLAQKVRLEWGDCLEMDKADYYDAVYSRDVFLHIADKAKLFSVLKTSLRAGGKLLFTDYCCGPKPWDNAFSEYVEARGYSLHTLVDYAELISTAGFEQVVYLDYTPRFGEILQSELDRISELDIADKDRDKLQQGWRQKLARSKAGDHRWGLFSAIRGA